LFDDDNVGIDGKDLEVVSFGLVLDISIK